MDFSSAEALLDFSKDLIVEGEEHEMSLGKFIQYWLDDSEEITVKTSGSTGKPKKMQVLKTHMVNSAKATGIYFKLPENTTALLCLSPDYIAGKMMAVRAMVLGWNLHVTAPEKDALTQYDNVYDFAAMVPYQVHHSLKALKKVKKLIIGGGSISRELEDKLQEIQTEIFATYGMTETLSHVAVRRLNGLGKTSVFSALPDVKFRVDEESCLMINAPEIVPEIIKTHDMVELLSSTSFKWLGRLDNVINTGGIKIHPEAVEEKLASTIKLPFLIASEKDEVLGERVILILEKKDEIPLPDFAEAFSKLSAYERPKKIYTVSTFVYTETEKIKRNDILKLLRKYK